MRTRDRGLLGNAASLVVCGALAGVVVAAAAFPAVAMSGLAAKASADTFGELPGELHVLPSPQITYVYASDGKTLLATIYDENRHDIPLSEVPQVMQDAIVAAEDARFYDHHGVDVQGVARAFVANQRTDSTQGASTLTMQYVRQALTYSASTPQAVIAATEQTNARKLREMKLALTLETALTKQEILERYLNIAAFGHGAYGIYAASQVYFSKPPKDLKLEEAAMLAGLVKAPSSFDPTTVEGRPQALDRRSYVLDQMWKTGKITKAEAEAANKAKLVVTGKRTPNGCVATPRNHWGFFCDFLYRWWLQQDAFGPDSSAREARLKAGGYRIVSSLDVSIQESAKKNIEKQVKTGSSDALMLAAIEPGTGRIKAMAVNRNYGLDTSKNGPSTDPAKRKAGAKGTYPTTTNPLISGGGDITGYKAGSIFKIFTLVAALEKGYPLDFTIRAVSPYKSQYPVDASSPAVCGDRVHWCPRNANPSWMNGVRNMWTGFGRSVNTYFVPLEEKVGAKSAINVAKRLGMAFRASTDRRYTMDDVSNSFGAFTLGVTDALPLEVANAYATLAADGKYCEPIPVIQITDHDGNKLSQAVQPRCRQAVKAEIARAAIDAARCPVGDQSALGRCSGATAGFVAELVKHPVAGKTGTSNSNWTANLVVTSKQLAIAGTMADPDHAEASHQMSSIKTNQAVADTLRDALKKLPKVKFTAPPEFMAYGKRVKIPAVACKSVDDARAQLRAAGFDVEVQTEPVTSPCPAGTVAGTDPSGSTSKNGTVMLLISAGTPATPAVRGAGFGNGNGGAGPPVLTR